MSQKPFRTHKFTYPQESDTFSKASSIHSYGNYTFYLYVTNVHYACHIR